MSIGKTELDLLLPKGSTPKALLETFSKLVECTNP